MKKLLFLKVIISIATLGSVAQASSVCTVFAKTSDVNVSESPFTVSFLQCDGKDLTKDLKDTNESVVLASLVAQHYRVATSVSGFVYGFLFTKTIMTHD
ncbi:MAG: hypothetical protein C5B49_10270 [Bdellovibrio sp.]|nr:MAG: hypothetical protein C5B49_10270 [Bdellovibrio sp.]